MKFDSMRVLATIDRFQQALRREKSEGRDLPDGGGNGQAFRPAIEDDGTEPRLARLTAEVFREMGWRITCRTVPGNLRPIRSPLEIALVALGCLTSGAALLTSETDWPRIAGGGVWVVSLAWMLLHSARQHQGQPTDHPGSIPTAPLLVAGSDGEPTGSPSRLRVRFQATLGPLFDPAVSSPAGRWRRITVGLARLSAAVMLLGALATVSIPALRSSHAIGGWLLLVSGLVWLGGWSIRGNWTRMPADEPLSANDLAGLAVLLELARTWPRASSSRRRFEVEFVAAGGQGLGCAGADASIQELKQGDAQGVRSLLVLLFAPGSGSELGLVAGPGCELAKECAASLWIPETPRLGHRFLGRLWPFEWDWPPFAAILGAEVGGPPKARSRRTHLEHELNPDAIARAAQLATEIALRWARLNRDQEPPAGVDSRTEARSSQKPG
jgi:hypothetical protein